MKKKKMKFFVSYYEQYPIYEPAEGGYYYAGNELIDSYVTGSLKSARRLFRKLLAEYDLPDTGRDFSRISGRYIGEDRMLRIETVQGIKESGKVVYQ